MIHFLQVTKRYPGGRLGLDGVSFRIDPGEFVFLTGPSGAGKSTLLKLVYREIMPTAGRILVRGRNVTSIPRQKVPFLRRKIGIVFQDFRLISRRTVFENISYLPRILGVGLQERKRLAYQTLRRVGLAHRMQAFPDQLSGGEKQRVAIARALIGEPELLVADEPTGNLDPNLSREILELFVEIHRKGTTVLVATHDPENIHRVGGRVLMLDQGRLKGEETLPGLHAVGPSGDPSEPDMEAARSGGGSP